MLPSLLDWRLIMGLKREMIFPSPSLLIATREQKVVHEWVSLSLRKYH